MIAICRKGQHQIDVGRDMRKKGEVKTSKFGFVGDGGSRIFFLKNLKIFAKSSGKIL